MELNTKEIKLKGFSPRNGEVILKLEAVPYKDCVKISFSPRNGEVILKMKDSSKSELLLSFQSPQWGSNSKGVPLRIRITKPSKMQFPTISAHLEK